MELFGFSISRKAQQEEKGYRTRYEEFNGNVLDGKNIVRNNATFYRMYRTNVDIRRSVMEKQETAMKDGYEVHKILGNGNEKVIEAPVFNEVMEASGGIYYIKNRIIASMDIFGNVYIRRVYNARGVMKYEVLDPRYVTIFTDSNLLPVRYMYQNPAKKGVVDRYEADTIIHFKNDDDLDNPLFGISPLESIVVDILGDEEASLSNHAYFQNDGIPSALYILKEGLTAQQQEDIYNRIQERLKGGHNKHKVLSSSVILDVKPINPIHTDMGFEKQRMMATMKVCVALGVPKTILGYVEDVNYSNGSVQYKKFIENTIRPLEKKLKEIFTLILQDFTDYKGLYFAINDEHIDDFEQRGKIAIDNINAGLWTRNEGREYIGYERFDSEYADQMTVNSNTRLLDDLANGTDPIQISPTLNP